MPDIRVNVPDRDYPIRIAPGALDDLGEFLLAVGRPTRLVVISDETVAALYEDSFDVRATLIEQREAAGLAGCQLLAATGVIPADWPRQ